jgi:beta-glucanase (GH16 family)
MTRKIILIIVLLALLGMMAFVVLSQDEQSSPLMDDFESGELFEAADEFSNAIGFVTWGDTSGNIALSLAEVERDGEMTSALAISYDIGAWGGFTHVLTDGSAWISQDWTAFGALQFSLYGNNTGGTVQVEIFDNRNPSINNDTAERWFYRITDDYTGWQQFTLPFDAFQRRTDWQPGGAPNDGLGLDAVSGYAFSMPAGTGAQVSYVDNVTVVPLAVEPIIIDDFEIEELFAGQDASGNNVGYIPWGDTAGNVSLRLVDAVRRDQKTRSLTIDFDIAAWGGFSRLFTDGESWTTQDWTAYNAISFWYMGSNTGAEIQFEVFDNRNPELGGDTAERWFYRFVDNSYSWQLIEIPFVEFARRSDWQPTGALDDGFNLNAVSGYAFGMPAGVGDQVAFVDDMRVFLMAGVDKPAGVAAAPAEEEQAPPQVTLPEVTPNEALLAPIPFAEPILISDFETGLPYVLDDGTAIGFVAWGDTIGNAVIGTTQVQLLSDLELPEASGVNQILRIDYNIGSWGGFTYAMTDGEVWTSQDWTKHNALQFWLYGSNTGQAIQVEIFDNHNPDVKGDSAERFFYLLLDDFEGWRQVTIPFAFFQRRVDWQPGGALDDGFNLNAVSGYAFGFPAGTGARTAYLDNLSVIVVEDPSQVTMSAAEERVTAVEIDESITWDSREWNLLWSDEFDAAAGTSINEAFWTCLEGGHGWGNNELEYYTPRTENVAHDGSGNLVITARQETLVDNTCWYGECSYTSARCVTQDKVEFTYGRVEARIKVPTGQGIWPALWMLGANFPEVPWPASGEIDILEHIGSIPDTIYGTVHGPGYSGGSGISKSYRADYAFPDDFHVYGIDWDPYIIRWYVDGELFGIVSVNDLQENQRWVYDHDFFLLMNLAVGGFWPGEPDETTQFPQQMLVDYVRVYQQK